ncbi:Protein of unknown function DUF3866 [Syntrophomonas zehnderi OL-4]|uniref:DUF3866 domain-containing protein n=1 Tax=Syntrophomonas zehnderi OL-4 TaxID=690567 RepID=A0A0E4GAZ1_9FIRM|nr:DUF3866 family protein [Syntrophomonas zehnderi]CFX50597.1 Protein of unknown function DUF3866 [Syntrophomonas zehnderi OL-4]
MIQTRKGKIIKELFSRSGIKGFTVDVDGREERCIVYTSLLGDIVPGDEVLLNTTAMALGLGSGGYHFVISKTRPDETDLKPGGHIMKLRYTPGQLKVLSVEEEDSPYHEEMSRADSLEGIPVLVATLHSMLAPISILLAEQGVKTAYVMTDGAALPINFSQTVDWLKRQEYLCGTVTVGHAFGGDLEAVNIYSGLLAARHVLKADVIIVSMGPGIVGTGTKWGFTGIEQGEVLNAVDTLLGAPIAVPRISFADARPRHQGISHHTITVLSRVCKVSVLVPLPFLTEEQNQYILDQLYEEGLFNRHQICMEESLPGLAVLEKSELKMTTMGRGINDDREFYLTLAASAQTAIRLLNGQKPRFIKIT